MILSSLFSFLKKKQKSLKLPDSILIKRLKRVCKNNNISVYENITIYHHDKNKFIPLLILDQTRGIFLFEYKEWSYDELKGATLLKATNQESDEKTLAFERVHKFIKQKFNELTHSDGVEIYNYLLMENLNKAQYEHLDDSFKELLPEDKVMFSDSSEDEILQKFQKIPKRVSKISDEVAVMGNLLIQYLIFSRCDTMHLATKEQIEFIESDISGLKRLSSKMYCGKTNSILLKAILYKLKQPDFRVVIIEPTTLACDMLKQKMLKLTEYAIVEIDITSIQILTPFELINKHLQCLKRVEVGDTLYIDAELMRKKFNIADLIICDDIELLSEDFISYLKHIQKKSSLLLVSNKIEDDYDYKFDSDFRKNKLEVIIKKTNQHAKALQIIALLLGEYIPKEVLVISGADSRRKLKDDLECFIKEDVDMLDAEKSIVNQNFDNLLLCLYSQISFMSSKFVILLDVEEASLDEVEYALNLATDTAFVLYENSAANIRILKDKYV
jgi:nucleoside-triphosphatase THEP1